LPLALPYWGGRGAYFLPEGRGGGKDSKGGEKDGIWEGKGVRRIRLVFLCKERVWSKMVGASSFVCRSKEKKRRRSLGGKGKKGGLGARALFLRKKKEGGGKKHVPVLTCKGKRGERNHNEGGKVAGLRRS